MDTATDIPQSQTAAPQLLTEAYKDLIKNAIALPLEGCKSMATGCAAVAGLYGATLGFANYIGKPLQATDWHVYVLLGPFIFLALAGFLFGVGYLPDTGLSTLLPADGAQANLADQHTRVLAREKHIRDKLRYGTIAFWFAIAWALVNLAFVRVS